MTTHLAENLATDEKFASDARPYDCALRNEIVEAHAGLARHLARRFASRGEPLEDLVQVAMVGLLMAAERFDPEKGHQFSSFAVPTVLGELRRHFRDKGWGVRVPRRLQELHLRIGSVVSELGQELGHSPSVPEVAERLGCTVDEVLEGMEAGHAYRPDPLEMSVTDDDSDGAREGLVFEDSGFAEVEERLTAAEFVRSLPVREQAIFRLRFVQDMTQSEIAEVLGVSQMQVSRLLSRGLRFLRSQLTERS